MFTLSRTSAFSFIALDVVSKGNAEQGGRVKDTTARSLRTRLPTWPPFAQLPGPRMSHFPSLPLLPPQALPSRILVPRLLFCPTIPTSFPPSASPYFIEALSCPCTSACVLELFTHLSHAPARVHCSHLSTFQCHQGRSHILRVVQIRTGHQCCQPWAGVRRESACFA